MGCTTAKPQSAASPAVAEGRTLLEGPSRQGSIKSDGEQAAKRDAGDRPEEGWADVADETDTAVKGKAVEFKGSEIVYFSELVDEQFEDDSEVALRIAALLAVEPDSGLPEVQPASVRCARRKATPWVKKGDSEAPPTRPEAPSGLLAACCGCGVGAKDDGDEDDDDSSERLAAWTLSARVGLQWTLRARGCSAHTLLPSR
eukprot:CAMPEP_0195104578 /NCGR_PEP_ID=MMETSP0448-20130528/73183_1 /TAXON_ID=66468 /ORGANISM="Heterocapsa triquestra, Strain CCMP 448" /LENGTH=200 /DNA_ID=CAMNT_0040140437 /DNA_START=62 /DNA_END=661 /DNA_ORIENTATION=-